MLRTSNSAHNCSGSSGCSPASRFIRAMNLLYCRRATTPRGTSRDNSRRCFAGAARSDALQRADQSTTELPMKNFSIAIVAALSLLSFAACKKGGGGSDQLAKMNEFKDQMCKCVDKAC